MIREVKILEEEQAEEFEREVNNLISHGWRCLEVFHSMQYPGDPKMWKKVLVYIAILAEEE